MALIHKFVNKETEKDGQVIFLGEGVINIWGEGVYQIYALQAQKANCPLLADPI